MHTGTHSRSDPRRPPPPLLPSRYSDHKWPRRHGSLPRSLPAYPCLLPASLDRWSCHRSADRRSPAAAQVSTRPRQCPHLHYMRWRSSPRVCGAHYCTAAIASTAIEMSELKRPERLLRNRPGPALSTRYVDMSPFPLTSTALRSMHSARALSGSRPYVAGESWIVPGRPVDSILVGAVWAEGGVEGKCGWTDRAGEACRLHPGRCSVGRGRGGGEVWMDRSCRGGLSTPSW